MAAFLNGGGDLGSTTMENAFVEVVLRAEILDLALATPTGNITDDLSAGGTTIALNATIPVVASLVSGKYTLTATDFLSEVFDPGTSGTLTSTTYPAAILELAQKIQALEIAQNESVLNVVFNADAQTVTCTGTFAITRTILAADGSQKLVATDYLT
jgi:hypothetical protein